MIWYENGHNSPLESVPDSVTHLFGLVLRPLRGRMHETRLIAVSDTMAELIDLLHSERVETYSDGWWQKSFRAGGLLEWCSPPSSFDGPADEFGHGLIELRRDAWRRSA